ncbi:TrbC/VirB2 family protein [Paraburkholderia susongensis]|uniref:TrbC/VIRB2 family protein n=1 Tax=Paraburkholderia susongensis TaxID=1515439 RepID=A0A1X7M841_9BURK|nr:TrbC/VirB2 family protein [Paraburkholderia susongensis]SMG61569.1 hypothetical protein SAMN06265784_12333 [Paraburkholderia susongensis]
MKTTQNTTKHTFAVLITICAALATLPAHAGGLDSGTTAVTNFKVWLYGLAGIGAAIYLLYKAVECWGERASWAEFGKAVAWVAAAGATSVLAPWAWNLMVN